MRGLVMNPTELRSTLKVVNLTPHRAARLLGVNPRTVRRWLQEPGGAGLSPCPTHDCCDLEPDGSHAADGGSG